MNEMRKNNVHTLIIPDVHGRTFWKDAINQFPKDKYKDLNIVFLGDYLDPYENYPGVLENEGWPRRHAIDNFKEIIECTKNDSRIHLLFGNHDMHYWYDARYKSRVDIDNYNEIKQIFLDNFDLFNVAYDEVVDDVKYLYTHAGVTSFWLEHLHFVGNNGIRLNKEVKMDRLGVKRKQVSDEQLPFCKMLANMTPTADELNQMKSNFQGEANLWRASYVRGGDYDCGSCIWADLEEWAYTNADLPGIFQIFGHTLFGGGDPDTAVIEPNGRSFAMLDSRQAWCLDYEGNLKPLKELS